MLLLISCWKHGGSCCDHMRKINPGFLQIPAVFKHGGRIYGAGDVSERVSEVRELNEKSSTWCCVQVSEDLSTSMALYMNAAEISEKAERKQGASKTSVYDSKFPNIKQLFASVCETQRFSSVSEEIIEATKSSKHTKSKMPSAKVSLYDSSIGRGSKCGGAWKAKMMKHRPRSQAESARMKVRRKVSRNEDLLPAGASRSPGDQSPRYVRVNTSKTTVGDAVDYSRREGFSYSGQAVKSDNLASKNKDFVVDSHLPEVSVFPPKTDFHDHFSYKAGHIISQDKASCLPAHLLQPPPGSHVIDACAAPGNKTSHSAAIMENRGRSFAFDSDGKRLATMSTSSLRAGVTCQQSANQDFLKVDPADPQYKDVEYISSDPSCSGSGMVCSRDDSAADQEDEEKARSASSASFQSRCSNHGLKFPRSKRSVYSTCSIHFQENEDVVTACSQQNPDFRSVPSSAEWPERGSEPSSQCLRASTIKTLTHGFFVASSEKANDAGSAKEKPAVPMSEARSVLPGSVLPGSVLPGSVLPGSVLPGSVLPGSVLPGSVSPGSVSPGSVSPGSVSPGSVSPGSVSPAPSAVAEIPEATEENSSSDAAEESACGAELTDDSSKKKKKRKRKRKKKAAKAE